MNRITKYKHGKTVFFCGLSSGGAQTSKTSGKASERKWLLSVVMNDDCVGGKAHRMLGAFVTIQRSLKNST